MAETRKDAVAVHCPACGRLLDPAAWYDNPEPRLLRTEYGRWLAVSGLDAPISIGVMGLTADGARENFRRAALEWAPLPEEKQP